MRRLAFVALITLTACTTPPLRLSPAFPIGATRVYDLRVDATTTIGSGADARRDHSTLEARSTIQVLDATGDEIRVRLTVEPTRNVTNGAAQTPATQTVEMTVAPDGQVIRIESVGGVPADIAGDSQDLAPLIGIPLPTGQVHLGQRWRRTVPSRDANTGAIEQTGRVLAVRVTEGYDTVIVRVGQRRPLARARDLGGTVVQLVGTEDSTSEIAFAFRDGFPVTIASDAEGRFTVVGGTGQAVTIRTHSDLTLIA